MWQEVKTSPDAHVFWAFVVMAGVVLGLEYWHMIEALL